MQAIVDAIKYFYEQFILRDVLAYVTPGTILVSAIALQYKTPEKIQSILAGMPLIAYIPIVGFLFIVGFGLQNLGEMTRLLKWHERKDDAEQLKYLEDFHGHTKNDESGWLERTRERINVKKNMASTAAVAITISILFFLINLLEGKQIVLTWAVLGVSMLLVLSLWYGHKRQREILMHWEDAVIRGARSREQTKQNKNPTR